MGTARSVRQRAEHSRTSESPAYWLARHMTRCARGKDHPQRAPAPSALVSLARTATPAGRNKSDFTRLHLLSYGYIL
ncbi:hypothetical protein GQF42_09620 [Streptomyces broussonetiae]|uniref:Uncharacterized protein n=1 Tax=Streptomyces broussonetiae TaxID=2686304 RepID=A0A6I6N0L0_9ACTN|nr:hypothetical protein GQF42_09620 [Streptomyces broussonetiae]